MAAKKKSANRPPPPPKPEAKAPPLDRIRKLLALAADAGASEEERRTAAVTAARLMKEHGIQVGEPQPTPVHAQRAIFRDGQGNVVGQMLTFIAEPQNQAAIGELGRIFSSLFSPQRRK